MPRLKASTLNRPRNLWEVFQGPNGGFNGFPIHTALWLFKTWCRGSCGAFAYLPGEPLFKWAKDEPQAYEWRGGTLPNNSGDDLFCLAWLLCLPALGKGPKPSRFLFLWPEMAERWSPVLPSRNTNCGIHGERLGEQFKGPFENCPWPIKAGKGFDFLGEPWGSTGYRLAPHQGVLTAFRALRLTVFHRIFSPFEIGLLTGEKEEREGLLHAKACINALDGKTARQEIAALEQLHGPRRKGRPQGPPREAYSFPPGWTARERQAAMKRWNRPKPSLLSLPYRGLPIFDARPLVEEAGRIMDSWKFGHDPATFPFMGKEDWNAIEEIQERNWTGKKAAAAWIAKIYGLNLYQVTGLSEPSEVLRSTARKAHE